MERYEDNVEDVLARCKKAMARVGIEGEEAEAALEHLATPPPTLPTNEDATPPVDEPPDSNRKWSDRRIDAFARLVLLPSPPNPTSQIHQMTLRDKYWLQSQDCKDREELVQVLGKYRGSVIRAFRERVAKITKEMEMTGKKESESDK